MWNSLSKDEKNQYSAQARTEKVQTQQNMKKIEIRLGMSLRKPVCAYSLFMKDHRQKTQQNNPLLDHVEVMKLVSNMWKNLSAEERKAYNDRAEADKTRYQKDRLIFS